MSGSVSVRTVTQTAITISDDGGADDSGNKSSDETEKSSSEGKLRTFLRVFEKINMVFILMFICYLSWTIPAHYGLYSSESDSKKFSGNQTILLQVRNVFGYLCALRKRAYSNILKLSASYTKK